MVTLNFAGKLFERDRPQLTIADPDGQQLADAVSGLIAREREYSRRLVAQPAGGAVELF